MTTPAHITITNHRDELATAVLLLLERQLPAKPITHTWPEPHRILFRTVDGRTYEVEVFVNWDAAPTESDANASVTR